MIRRKETREAGGVRGADRTAGAGDTEKTTGTGRIDRTGGSGEAGSITVFVAVFAVALFALAGLVLDGGRAVSAQQAAQDEADQAARSGAAALSVSALRTGAVELDSQAAVANAVAYTVAAGHPGTATVVGNSVEVSIHFRVSTDILGMIGIDSLSVSATARAVDVHGVTREE